MWGKVKKADGAVVEIVSVEVIGLGPGVTVIGEKVQEDRAGRLAQERETALLKGPNCGLMVTV